MVRAAEGAVVDDLPVQIVEALVAGDGVDTNDAELSNESPYFVAASNLDVNGETNSQGDGTIA